MPDVRFSVIIPCTRGLQGLLRLLPALGGLDYPAERFEVLIVDCADDGSPTPGFPGTPQAGVRTHCLSLPGATRPQALNAAVRESKGEFLAFLDTDCVPRADWLRSYDEAFEAWLAGAIGGSFEPPGDGDAYQKCAARVHGAVASAARRQCPRSANMAARREAVLLAGGFDEDAMECPEIRMVARMQHIGYRTFHCPGAVVSRYSEAELMRFLRADFRTGLERSRFHRSPVLNALGLGIIATLSLIVLVYDVSLIAHRAIGFAVGAYVVVLAVLGVQAAVSVGSLAAMILMPLLLAMHHAVYAIGYTVGRFVRA